VRALGYKRKDYTIEGIVLGAYPCRPSLQVVEPPELPVDSNEFQWVPVGPGGLAAPLDHNNKLVIVVVTALRHSVVDSTPRAVDQPGYSTFGCCSYRATGL